MSSLRPILTRRYPITQNLAANASSRAPVLSSISLYRPTATTVSFANSQSSFSTSAIRTASSHDDHYDPPTGWLFGVPPGEKYQNEGWEPYWVWGFWGTFIVGGIAYAFKPDTSIQTWALEEARRRLEAEGILPDPDTAGNPTKSN